MLRGSNAAGDGEELQPGAPIPAELTVLTPKTTPAYRAGMLRLGSCWSMKLETLISEGWSNKEREAWGLSWPRSEHVPSPSRALSGRRRAPGRASGAESRAQGAERRAQQRPRRRWAAHLAGSGAAVSRRAIPTRGLRPGRSAGAPRTAAAPGLPAWGEGASAEGPAGRDRPGAATSGGRARGKGKLWLRVPKQK